MASLVLSIAVHKRSFLNLLRQNGLHVTKVYRVCYFPWCLEYNEIVCCSGLSRSLQILFLPFSYEEL